MQSLRRVLGNLKDGLLVVLFFAFLIFIVFVFREQETEIISGHVDIIDGDSLSLNNMNIRLAGIDAPEHNQKCTMPEGAVACGTKAKQHLQQLIDGQVVSCRVFGHDFYDRVLATCHAGNIALNEQMVRDGWAIDYGGYADLESIASTGKRGLWAGTFETPEDFRHNQGASDENSISHYVALAMLKARKMGRDLAQRFGLYGE